MATDHLEIPALVTSQSDKVTTINESDNLLDRAMNQVLAHDINNTSTTLTDTQPTDAEAKQNYLIEVSSTSALTANRTISVPADEKVWVFRGLALNQAEQYSVTVQVVGGGGAGVVIPAGGQVLIHCDGTDCVELLRQDASATAAFAGTTGAQNIDFNASTIRTVTQTGNITLTLNNPVQGKAVLIVATPATFTFTLPGSVTIIGGGALNTSSVNYINLLCTNAVTPTYVATVAQ